MKISIEATGKEIADLILQLQGQPCLKDEIITEIIDKTGKKTNYPLDI